MGDAADALARSLRGLNEIDRRAWAADLCQSAGAVPADAEHAWIRRVKTSHRGIGERRSLKRLAAFAVDQSFLDEICTLDQLELLYLNWPVTASHLGGLRNLSQLRHLSIDSPRNVMDFTPLVEIPSLRRLFVENAKHLHDVEWLSGAHHLQSIGVEGSIWTKQHIDSLRPLAGLRSVEGLFLTSVRLRDKDLTPLADCPKLKVLQCARFAPRTEFERLHRLRPDIQCYWFDPAAWED
jgi:hypothetical protein